MPTNSKRTTRRRSAAAQLSATRKIRRVSREGVGLTPALGNPLDPPKGWKPLWLKAQKEKDPEKLIKLIDQLNALLTEREKQCAAEQSVAASTRGAQSRKI